MKNAQSINLFLSSLIIILLLTSCSEVGLMSEKNSYLVEEITDFSSFISVYIVLQISILLTAFLLMFIFDAAGYGISILLHFIWVVSYRDYGFLVVLLLFFGFSLVMFLVNFLLVSNQARRR